MSEYTIEQGKANFRTPSVTEYKVRNNETGKVAYYAPSKRAAQDWVRKHS